MANFTISSIPREYLTMMVGMNVPTGTVNFNGTEVPIASLPDIPLTTKTITVPGMFGIPQTQTVITAADIPKPQSIPDNAVATNSFVGSPFSGVQQIQTGYQSFDPQSNQITKYDLSGKVTDSYTPESSGGGFFQAVSNAINSVGSAVAQNPVLSTAATLGLNAAGVPLPIASGLVAANAGANPTQIAKAATIGSLVPTVAGEVAGATGSQLAGGVAGTTLGQLINTGQINPAGLATGLVSNAADIGATEATGSNVIGNVAGALTSSAITGRPAATNALIGAITGATQDINAANAIPPVQFEPIQTPGFLDSVNQAISNVQTSPVTLPSVTGTDLAPQTDVVAQTNAAPVVSEPIAPVQAPSFLESVNQAIQSIAPDVSQTQPEQNVQPVTPPLSFLESVNQAIQSIPVEQPVQPNIPTDVFATPDYTQYQTPTTLPDQNVFAPVQPTIPTDVFSTPNYDQYQPPIVEQPAQPTIPADIFSTPDYSAYIPTLPLQPTPTVQPDQGITTPPVQQEQPIQPSVPTDIFSTPDYSQYVNQPTSIADLLPQNIETSPIYTPSVSGTPLPDLTQQTDFATATTPTFSDSVFNPPSDNSAQPNYTQPTPDQAQGQPMLTYDPDTGTLVDDGTGDVTGTGTAANPYDFGYGDNGNLYPSADAAQTMAGYTTPMNDAQQVMSDYSTPATSTLPVPNLSNIGSFGSALKNTLTNTPVGQGLTIGALGSLLQGYLGSNAANTAAQIQANATQNAINQMTGVYNQQAQQNAPYRGLGYQAANTLGSLLPGQSQRFDAMGNPIGTQTGSGYLTQQFSPQDFAAGIDPGYAFRLQQGQMANQRAGNVAGGALSGNVLKGLQDYTQGAASQEYQNAFNRFQTQRQNIYSNLANIAGLGQTSQGQQNQLASDLAKTTAQMQVGNAAAQAAGQIGQANAYGNAIGGVGNAITLASLLGQKQSVAGS